MRMVLGGMAALEFLRKGSITQPGISGTALPPRAVICNTCGVKILGHSVPKLPDFF